MDRTLSREQVEATPDVEAGKPARPTNVQEVLFVLNYDREIAFLTNEGHLRSGIVPSGIKQD